MAEVLDKTLENICNEVVAVNLEGLNDPLAHFDVVLLELQQLQLGLFIPTRLINCVGTLSLLEKLIKILALVRRVLQVFLGSGQMF